MRILIATQNPGKFTEISNSLKSNQGLKVIGIPENKADIIVEETGRTYMENSLIKAKAFYQNDVDFSLADDAGIEIPVIQNLLGVKTRRFGAGEKATDQEWLDYFLNYFQKFKGEQRVAYFKTFLCLYKPDQIQYFEGILKGRLAEQQMCEITPGIPLSSVFIPEGFDVSLSQMSIQEKNNISHRGLALKKLNDYLKKGLYE